MIVGIGTDLVHLPRIEKVFNRFPTRFMKRILAEAEYVAYEACQNQVVFLAKRFAIKEAAAKALGCGFRDGVQFIDFMVTHTKAGQPQLRLTGRALEKATEKQITGFHVSVTDEGSYVLAFVVYDSRAQMWHPGCVLPDKPYD